MENLLLSHIQIKVNKNIYLKNPETSDLGIRIVMSSVEMIHEMGLESFTFKKLSAALETTESSIYRYFENKHKLLIYLINYYWAYLEYAIVFQTHNISKAEDKLLKALEVLSDPTQLESNAIFLPMDKLNHIVIAESSKAYLTKEVDDENKAGFFIAFKNVAKRIVEFVVAIDSKIQYPNTLVSTCIEGILHQQFFAKHLPSLTDFTSEEEAENRTHIFYQMIMNNLNQH